MDELNEVENQNEENQQNENKENIVETIIQNGVSKEELKSMLNEILGTDVTKVDTAAIEAAETEYFGSHLKY